MATELLIQMYKTEVNYKKYYAYDIFTLQAYVNCKSSICFELRNRSYAEKVFGLS